MADIARVQEIGTSAEACVPPDDPGALIKIRNLDDTNFVIVAIKPGVTATIPQADEMIYLGPGEFYYARREQSYSMIADTAACIVELEIDLGRR